MLHACVLCVMRATPIHQVKLYYSLGIFCRRQIDDIFLIFPPKQDLTFHANCLLICMKCHILFSGKNKKKYFKMSSAENFAQSAKRKQVYVKYMYPITFHC